MNDHTTTLTRPSGVAGENSPEKLPADIPVLANDNTYESHNGGPAVRLTWGGKAALTYDEKQAIADHPDWTLDESASTDDYYVVRPTTDD